MEILKCENGNETPVKPTEKIRANYSSSCFLPQNKAEIIDVEIVAPDPVITDGKDYFCHDCGKRIGDERVMVLQSWKMPSDRMNCFDCAEKNISKVKGFYAGIPGISGLMIAKDVGAETHLVDLNEAMSEAINETELAGEEFFDAR